MDNKTYLELSEEEIKSRTKLTATEELLVSDFLKAARALPKSICIAVDDDEYEPTLKVSKRITRGSCQVVASLRKKSLCF